MYIVIPEKLFKKLDYDLNYYNDYNKSILVISGK